MTTTSPTRCDVVVPVHNSIDWVARCLGELFAHTPQDVLGQVVVVDDASAPDSRDRLEALCAQFDRVTLHSNGGRRGFGGACNYGASLTSSKYLLFLNTDCLITPRTIPKLMSICEREPTVGMVCPVSNNSPILTLPIFPGRSYLEMNELCERAMIGAHPDDLAPDACTVVGNCLLVTRACWEATKGFHEMWGVGYGEESDLQFRAIELGFRGVVALDTYVFHFGSASFRFASGNEELKQRNHALFLDRWGELYRRLFDEYSRKNPLEILCSRIDALGPTPLKCDVLFVLPGISQSVGGIHVVLDICNAMVLDGVHARCAVVGQLDPAALAKHEEPIYTGILAYPNDEAFYLSRDVRPRVVVATLFSTMFPAHVFARRVGARVINFVQGYEFAFENGMRREEVHRACQLADETVVTSRWLLERLASRTPSARPTHLPIGVNENQFFPASARSSRSRVRVGLALRDAPDKGQWVLLDVLEDLLPLKDRVCLTVFYRNQPVPAEWLDDPDTVAIQLPVGRELIARALRDVDVFVDASLHEGFGLLPLEAMACGAAVVVSDSGGINEYMAHGENGIIVTAVNKPERFVEAIRELVDAPGTLAAIAAAAAQTSRQYRASERFAAYTAYFRKELALAGSSRPRPLTAAIRGVGLLSGAVVSSLRKPTSTNGAVTGSPGLGNVPLRRFVLPGLDPNMVDRLNGAIKRTSPSLHSALKRAMSTWYGK